MVKGCPCVVRHGKCAKRKAVKHVKGKAKAHKKGKRKKKKKVCTSKGVVIPCICQKYRGEERQGCIDSGGKAW